jgi:Flp pilus assembly protein TadG
MAVRAVSGIPQSPFVVATVAAVKTMVSFHIVRENSQLWQFVFTSQRPLIAAHKVITFREGQ